MPDQTKEAYVRLCEGYFENEHALSDEELSEGRMRVAQLSRELVQAVRTVHRARIRSSGLARSATASHEEREQEYEALLSLPMVRGIEVGGSVLTIHTDPLVLGHDGSRYQIGEFEVDLDLEGSIVIRNVANTIQKGGWEHPHVQGGAPCLGNVRDGMMKLLGECELVPLVSLLIQFLQTYEPETAYCGIEMWEEVR